MARPWETWCRILRWLRASRGRPERKTPRQIRGKRAETAAARLLQRNGYRILERNYTVPGGEIDIIAFHRGVLAFVEVRSLSKPARMDPLETVGVSKQRRIIRAAEHYMTRRRTDRTPIATRYDIVSVALDESGRPAGLRHVQNAFQAGGRSFA